MTSTDTITAAPEPDIGERTAARLRLLRDEYSNLDRDYFEAMYDGNEETQRALRQALKRNHLAFEQLRQENGPRPVSVLEAERLDGLAYQRERSGYRISAKPFLHEKRWWEPGYLDEE